MVRLYNGLVKGLVFVVVVVLVLGGILEVLGWPFFRIIYWEITTYPKRHMDAKLAPHDLVLGHLAILRRDELPSPDARDLGPIADVQDVLLRVEFSSRVDFEAYVYQTKYRSEPYLGICKNGEPDSAKRAWGVFDRYGQIDYDAEWYSAAPPGSPHPLQAHPRAPTSGSPDRNGFITYSLYLPVEGRSVAGIKNYLVSLPIFVFLWKTCRHCFLAIKPTLWLFRGWRYWPP